MAARYRAYASGVPAPPEHEARALAVQRRNAILFAGLRIIIAPLTLVALILSLVHWRRYAVVVAPALFYLLGLSLTFAKPRFRELSDPLLFIPLAALVSDMLFGTVELGPHPSRRVKVATGTALIVLAGAANALAYLR